MVEIPQRFNAGGDTSYLGLSKPIGPITPPEADKSTGLLLSGLGNSLEGAVTVADNAIKQQIQQDVYTGVDKERDKLIEGLGVLKNAAGTPQAQNTAAKAYDLFTPNGAVPTQPNGTADTTPIDNISSQVANYQSALRAGSISLTYYKAQLDNLAKTVRSNYGPGYRPYIDEEFKKAGAGDTANEYVEALVKDLNQFGSDLRDREKRADEALEAAAKTGVPGADSMLALRQAGRVDRVGVFTYLNAANAEHYKYERDKQALELSKLTREMDQQKATEIATDRANSSGLLHFKAVVGALPGVQTTEDLQTLAADAVAHPEKYKDAPFDNLAQQVQLNRRAWEAQFDKDMNTPGQDGRTLAQRVGLDKLTQIKKEKGDAIFGSVYDAFNNQQYGLALNNMLTGQRILERSTRNMLEDPDMGPPARVSAAVNKLFGNQVAGALVGPILQNGTAGDIKNYLQKEVQKSVLPKKDVKASTGEDYKPLIAIFKELNGQGVRDPNVPATFINHLDNITNRKLPDAAKLNLIKWAFDPENRNSLNQLSKDVYDPQKGQWTQGRSAMFNKMTSQDKTDEIYRLTRSDPTTWNNYKKWVAESFGYQIFPEDLANISKYIEQGTGIKWQDGHLQLTDNFDSRFAARAGFRGANSPGAVGAVARVNQGLDNLRTVIQKDTKDATSTDAFLYNTLKTFQVDPNRTPAARQLPADMGKKVMDAIAATAKNFNPFAGSPSQKAPQSPGKGRGRVISDGIGEGSAPIMEFGKTDREPTLQDFLDNPAGGKGRSIDNMSVDELKMELQRREAERTGTLRRPMQTPLPDYP